MCAHTQKLYVCMCVNRNLLGNLCVYVASGLIGYMYVNRVATSLAKAGQRTVQTMYILFMPHPVPAVHRH